MKVLYGQLDDAGVLHRDIKPENILVSDHGEPLLADVGIAHRLGTSSHTTTAAALTPAQGAPEFLAGGKPSLASDIYSLPSAPIGRPCPRERAEPALRDADTTRAVAVGGRAAPPWVGPGGTSSATVFPTGLAPVTDGPDGRPQSGS